MKILNAAGPLCRLDEVATIERDAVAPDAIKSGTNYVGLEHIDSDGGFVGMKGVSAGELASNKFRFGPKHILFGKLRPYLRKTALPDFEGICSTDIVPILPGPRVDRSFLFHFLRHPKTVEQAVLRCAGANLPRLSPRDLSAFEVPVPPLPEQRRIADILDKADAIRRKRKEAIALTEELLRSAFLGMFGDPVTNPKGWEERPLRAIVPEIQSGWSPVCLARRADDHEWGVIKLGAVTFGRFDDAENKALGSGHEAAPELEVKVGDVLFSRKNSYEHVAACVLVSQTRPRLMIPDLVFRFVLPRDCALLPSVLWGMLSNRAKRRQIQGLAGGTAGSMPNISKERLREVTLPIPDMGEQLRFARVLNRVECMRARIESALVRSESLFGALVNRAFPGFQAMEGG